jgi:hypothetical protein
MRPIGSPTNVTDIIKFFETPKSNIFRRARGTAVETGYTQSTMLAELINVFAVNKRSCGCVDPPVTRNLSISFQTDE